MVLSKLDLDYTEGGLFFTTRAKKAKVHSMTKLSKKFVDMGAFLFELGYDLSLNPRKNVSKSPGFKSCGLFA